MNSWLLLITHLPTENATARQRTWRNLKAAGAAVLRDGVYLLPAFEACRGTLNSLAADVLAAGGTALVLETVAPVQADFVGLFDRGEDFAKLLAEIAQARMQVSAETVNESLKQARKLRKTFTSIRETDFFPGEAQRQAEGALLDLEQLAARSLAPDEPGVAESAVLRLNIADYQGRLWATRRRPWVDRLACAWLIRRMIDPAARIQWLASAADCPAEALGFDFDGARFSHVGARVSFEVLLASFGLETPGLLRLGALVHYLDVGGVQPPEAIGVEQTLAGLRDTVPDDDQLLALSSHLFDGLLASFDKKISR